MPNLLKRNNMIPLLHIRHPLTHTLYNARTLMPRNDRKRTLWILAAQHVGIRVADTGVVGFYSHFMSLGSFDLDVLYHEVLAGLPGDGRFACDGFTLGRHFGGRLLCFGVVCGKSRYLNGKLE